MKNYSIGQVSKLVDLPTKTIRFYEESGVISPATRSENGYRVYTASAIEELKILKYARDLGLPLTEIKKLMKGCDERGCEHSKTYISESITDFVELLDSRLIQMATLRNKLMALKKSLNSPTTKCDSGAYCCNILHQLIDQDLKGGESL